MDSTLLFPILLGWFGGLFVNYASDVLPITRRFSQPACSSCKTPFNWLDYMTLRACRECGTRRSLRTWLVQIIFIALFLNFWLIPPKSLGLILSLIVMLPRRDVRVAELARHAPAQGRVAADREGMTLPAATAPAGQRVDVPGMIWTLIRTDFKSRYHGTLGGFVWALLKPALMFVVLMSVFSLIFASTPNYRLNLIVGLFLWEFFVEATKTGLTSLHAKAFLLTKARFPPWVLVVASLSNAMITLALFALTFLAYLVVVGQAPGALEVALSLLYLVLFFFVVTGFSLRESAEIRLAHRRTGCAHAQVPHAPVL